MTMEAARRPSSRNNQPNVKAAHTPDYLLSEQQTPD